jgi:hypothetical protein
VRELDDQNPGRQHPSKQNLDDQTPLSRLSRRTALTALALVMALLWVLDVAGVVSVAGLAAPMRLDGNGVVFSFLLTFPTGARLDRTAVGADR